jgi:O-antigen/teichoic acid export membrane protein
MLLTGVAAVVAKVMSVVSLLVTVPLTLGYLGPERYGMWMTISSLVAMMSFADLGIGNGLLNAVSDANGRDDTVAIRKYISSAYAVLSIVALFIIVCFASAYDLVVWHKIFNVQTALARNEAGPALAVFAVFFACNIALGAIQRIQTGLQQGFTTNLWQCAGSLFSLFAIVAAIRCEASLPWLVAAAVGAPLIATLTNTIVFFAAMRPDLVPSLRLVCRDSIKRITKVGLLFLATQIAIAAAYLSDNLVIAQVLGPESVTQFAVAEKMFSLTTIAMLTALAPLWPAYSEATARGDHAWAKRTLVRSLRLAGGIASLLSIFLVLLGPLLLELWVGHAVSVPFQLLLALGLWKIVEAIGNALAMYMNGVGLIRLQAILGTAMAALAIVLKFILVSRIGIVGATVATTIAYCTLVLVPLSLIIPKRLRSNAVEIKTS